MKLQDYKKSITALAFVFALIPTVIWFLILSAIAFGINMSGLNGDWLHHYKWHFVHLFILLFYCFFKFKLRVLNNDHPN